MPNRFKLLTYSALVYGSVICHAENEDKIFIFNDSQLSWSILVEGCGIELSPNDSMTNSLANITGWGIYRSAHIAPKGSCVIRRKQGWGGMIGPRTIKFYPNLDPSLMDGDPNKWGQPFFWATAAYGRREDVLTAYCDIIPSSFPDLFNSGKIPSECIVRKEAARNLRMLPLHHVILAKCSRPKGFDDPQPPVPILEEKNL